MCFINVSEFDQFVVDKLFKYMKPIISTVIEEKLCIQPWNKNHSEDSKT